MKAQTIIEKLIKLSDEFIVYFDNLKGCAQDPEWNAEGDVWNHTLNVIVESIKISEEKNLSEKDTEILLYSAALHDIGKPYSSTIEDGRIRSHGHSKLGYKITNQILSKTDYPFQDKLQIMNLIKYHGKPNWVYDNDNPEYEVIKMSMDCRLDLLYYLSVADFKGRIANDTNECLLNIDIFAEYAKELNCFGNKYQFKSNIAKFNYLVKMNIYHTDEPYDDTRSKVILMSGLPGTGKDTFISKNYPNIPVVSLDDIRKELKLKPNETGRVIQIAKERARQYLRKGENFIWNATNTSKQTRESLIELFNTYKAFIVINYVYTNFNKCVKRNRSREDVVPYEVLEKMLMKQEIPMCIESHRVNYFEII